MFNSAQLFLQAEVDLFFWCMQRTPAQKNSSHQVRPSQDRVGPGSSALAGIEYSACVILPLPEVALQGEKSEHSIRAVHREEQL